MKNFTIQQNVASSDQQTSETQVRTSDVLLIYEFCYDFKRY
jgi:hypothetical protein